MKYLLIFGLLFSMVYGADDVVRFTDAEIEVVGSPWSEDDESARNRVLVDWAQRVQALVSGELLAESSLRQWGRILPALDKYCVAVQGHVRGRSLELILAILNTCPVHVEGVHAVAEKAITAIDPDQLGECETGLWVIAKHDLIYTDAAATQVIAWLSGPFQGQLALSIAKVCSGNPEVAKEL